MARLSIRLDLGGSFPQPVVPVTLTHLDRTVQRVPITAAIPQSGYLDVEDLRPGTYSVQALLPNGSSLRKEVEVGDGSAHVLLDSPYRSPRETLAAAIASRPVLNEAATINFVGTRPARDLFLELWRNGEDGWQPTALPNGVDWMSQDSTNSLTARVEIYPDNVQRVLKVGGPKIPVRFVMVPPYVPSQVIVFPRSDELESPKQQQNNEGKALGSTFDPICVSVVTMNPVAEGLLSYALQGHHEAARIIQDTVAQELKDQEFQDPVGATAGAYAMLQSTAIPDVLDWLANLTDECTALSDGLLIISALVLGSKISEAKLRQLPAMRGLRFKAESDEQVRREVIAMTCLGMAYERGLPLYTEGLRLHLGILDMLDFGAPEGKRRHEWAYEKLQNIKALNRNLKYRQWPSRMRFTLEASDQTDWFARVTTVYSDRPDRISKRRTFWREPGEFTHSER
jgi:hypothetical protein